MDDLEFMQGFGNRVRKGLRYKQQNHHPMTQHTLAEKTGMHYTLISKYIRGKRMPSAAHAVQIAEALGVDIGWLLGCGSHAHE